MIIRMSTNANLTFLFCFVGLLCVSGPALAELESYPGAHRTDSRLPVAKWASVESPSESYAIQQIAKYLEEAHWRHMAEQPQRAQHGHRLSSHEVGGQQNKILEPDFTYSFPIVAKTSKDLTPFAVGPSDPRYYGAEIVQATEPFSRSYKSSARAEELKDDVAIVPVMSLPKAQRGSPVLINHDQVLQRFPSKREDKPGMYVIAMIAGISAAATVGLVAFGLGWYTLHKRTKAAADVEYPAYGVTGPHKEASPSASTADRRLAQSAQMYHYQHQKQQIIAMESRTNGEGTGSVSEPESDDENDEGDYTVYECPGLAPVSVRKQQISQAYHTDLDIFTL